MGVVGALGSVGIVGSVEGVGEAVAPPVSTRRDLAAVYVAGLAEFGVLARSNCPKLWLEGRAVLLAVAGTGRVLEVEGCDIRRLALSLIGSLMLSSC